MIGVVLEDVSNPFSSALHRSIEDVALARGVLVLAGSSDEDAEREHQLVTAFTSRRVDGLVIVPASHDHSYLLNERRAGRAIVFADRPPQFLDEDAVVTDNRAGVRSGIRHLIAHGHVRIAYLGDLQTIATATDRYQGYLDELSAQNILFDEHLVRVDLHGIAMAESAVAQLIASALAMLATGYETMIRRRRANLSSRSWRLLVIRSAALLVGLELVVWYLNLDRGVGWMVVFFVVLVLVLHYAITRTR
jgi:LacI family transcriptional regulator